MIIYIIFKHFEFVFAHLEAKTNENTSKITNVYNTQPNRLIKMLIVDIVKQ